MSEAYKRLKCFRPMAGLDDTTLSELSAQIEWLKADKGKTLLALGATDKDLLFLLDGEVILTASDGRAHRVRAEDDAAHAALSILRPSKYEVRAKTAVQYVRVNPHLLAQIPDSIDQTSSFSSSQYQVSDGEQDDMDALGNLLVNIYTDLHDGCLKVLSWRPASEAICARVLHEKYDLHAVADWVQMEPGLAIKVLRASARKSNYTKPAMHCREAVLRLGLAEVQRLAYLNLFCESVQPSHGHLAKVWSEHWESSVLTARLTQHLAQQCHYEDTTNAALAGLLHRFGAQVVLSYAMSSDPPLHGHELSEALRIYGRDTGKVVLAHWQMPPHLIDAVGATDTDFRAGPVLDMVRLASSYTTYKGNALDLDLVAQRLNAAGANTRGLAEVAADELAEIRAFSQHQAASMDGAGLRKSAPKEFR